jgi:methyl-accepting chemotaxis protein
MLATSPLELLTLFEELNQATSEPQLLSAVEHLSRALGLGYEGYLATADLPEALREALGSDEGEDAGAESPEGSALVHLPDGGRAARVSSSEGLLGVLTFGAAEDGAEATDDAPAIARIAHIVGRQLERLVHHGAALEAARRIASGATKANGLVMETLCGASQVTTHVTSAASAVEELRTTIQEISGRTNESTQASSDARSASRSASESVIQLQQSSDSIGKVSQVIGQLAKHTNLLSLNASIEAVHAGKAGVGFAVVASEIKQLSSETSDKAREIDAIVKEIQAVIRVCVEKIDLVSSLIGQADDLTGSIADSVSQQSVAVEDIASMMGAAAEQVDDVVQRLSDVGEVSMTFEADAETCLRAM